MMRTRTTVALTLELALIAVTASSAQEWWQTPEYVEADHVYKLDLVTPHVQWARPLPGGPVRAVFFMRSKGAGAREVAEVCQRGEISPEIVYYDRAGAVVEGAQAGMDRALRLIKQGADVFVFADTKLEALSGEAQYELFRTVIRDGAGLVCVYQWPKIAFTNDRIVELPDALTTGLPLAALPKGQELATALRLADPTHAELAEKIVTRFRMGAGRALGVRYPGGAEALTPRMAFSHEALAEYEYWAAFALKCILWSAGRDPQFVFGNWPEREVVLDRAALPAELSFTVTMPGPAAAQYVGAQLVPLDGLYLADLRRKAGARSKLGVRVEHEVPMLPAGRYALEVTTGDPRGADNFGAIAVRIASERGVEAVELNSEYAERGETIAGSVSLRGEGFAPDERLVLRLRDAEDRVVAQQQTAPAAQVPFSFNVPENTTILMRAEAVLVDGRGEVERACASFTVPDRKRGQFHFIMWDYPKGALGYWGLRSMRESGVTGILSGTAPGAEIAANDLAYVPYTTRILEEYDENGVMKPACWNSIAEMDAHINGIVAKSIPARRHGVYAYSLGDENHTRGACAHAACLEAWRSYLQDQYGSIAALNASWDSEYASFADITLYKPGDLNEQAALNDGHYSRWYDRQAFKRYNYAVYCGRYARAFEGIDPQAITGFEGAGRFGDDYDECIARVGFWGPYPNIGDDIIRSLAPPELITSNWMGYRREAQPMVQRMWRMISNRNHGVWWWRWDNIGEYHGFLAPDLHPWDDTSQVVIDEMADIRDGVGTWLLGAQMPHDGIGLLYSVPSAFAGGTGPVRNDDLDLSHQGFLEVVQDLGYAAHYLSDRSVVERNDLNEGDERVLILPMGRAIPDSVAEQIRSFVQSGGMVIADMRPGIRDGHCRLREAGVLDDVFGTSQTPADLQANPEYVEFALRATVGGERIETTLAGRPEVVPNAATGEAMGEVNGLPGVIVNRFGQGIAVLLNFPFAQYLALRTEGEEMPLRTLVGALLRMGGLQPPFEQSSGRGPLRCTETVRWRADDVQLVMLFKNAGEDGPATMRLPAPMHVYDLRTDKYLGRTGEVTAPLRVGFANLFAMAPGQLSDLALTVREAQVTAGDTVEVSVRLRGPDQGALPVRVRVFRPDGVEETWPRHELITEGGRARFDLRVAYNAMPGTWKLTARNVFTGQTAEAEMVVGG